MGETHVKSSGCGGDEVFGRSRVLRGDEVLLPQGDRFRGNVRVTSLPARHPLLKPNVPRPLGVKGGNPLAAGGTSYEEPW